MTFSDHFTTHANPQTLSLAQRLESYIADHNVYSCLRGTATPDPACDQVERASGTDVASEAWMAALSNDLGPSWNSEHAGYFLTWAPDAFQTTVPAVCRLSYEQARGLTPDPEALRKALAEQLRAFSWCRAAHPNAAGALTLICLPRGDVCEETLVSVIAFTEADIATVVDAVLPVTTH